MEELQSTEILDREIMEDARKKAHRLLKTADDTIKTKTAEWEKSLSEAVAMLEEKYSQLGRSVKGEIMARLPIDKQRAKAKKIEEMLYAAVETWYAGLSRERVLALLKNELAQRIAVCDKNFTGNELIIRISKIDRKEADTILKALIPGCSYTIEEHHSSYVYPELILETADMRIYASIGKTVDFLLGEKRAELLESLLGTAGEDA